MGVSTNALLFYGVPLGSPENDKWPEIFSEEDEGLDDGILVDIMGGPKEIDSGCEDLSYDDWVETDQFKKWKACNDERNAFLETLGVVLEMYCSNEYPMYALVIPESVRIAYRGFEEEIDTKQFSDFPKEEWDRKLKAVCEKLEVDFESKWYLVSYWG